MLSVLNNLMNLAISCSIDETFDFGLYSSRKLYVQSLCTIFGSDSDHELPMEVCTCYAYFVYNYMYLVIRTSMASTRSNDNRALIIDSLLIDLS